MNQSPALYRAPQVVLADDHSAIRKTVSAILTPHFEVVAAVSDGKAAVDAAARENPDLVLLDITIPELNGFQAAIELKQKQPDAKVVFLSGLTRTGRHILRCPKRGITCSPCPTYSHTSR